MRDVIKKVFPREGKTRPGAVVFSGGTKLTTFSDAVIQTAKENIGQLVEYTTTQNGQYVNLGEILPLGAAPATQSATVDIPQPSSPAGQAIDLQLRKYAERVALAVERIADAIERAVTAKKLSGAGAVNVPLIETPQLPPQPVSAVDAKQARLAEKVGPDAAAAMFSAIKRKSKTEEKLIAAADELLTAHGIEASA